MVLVLTLFAVKKKMTRSFFPIDLGLVFQKADNATQRINRYQLSGSVKKKNIPNRDLASE